MKKCLACFLVSTGSVALTISGIGQPAKSIGKEISIPVHLADGNEFDLSIRQLLAYFSVRSGRFKRALGAQLRKAPPMALHSLTLQHS